MKPDRIPRKAKLYPVIQITKDGKRYQKRLIKDGTRFDMQDGRHYIVQNGSIRNIDNPGLTKKQRNKQKTGTIPTDGSR